METLIQITYALLIALALLWLGWVTYCLISIKDKTPPGLDDLTKSIKDLSKLIRPEDLRKELSLLFRSPSDPQDKNVVVSTLGKVNASLASVNASVLNINNQNTHYETQIKDVLSKIRSSLDDLAKQKSLYDEQKLVLSEKSAEILKLNHELESSKNSLSESQKKYDEKIQEINEIRASHSVKLSEKDAEHAALTLSMRESNQKELEKIKTILDKHTELHVPAFINRSLEEDIHKLYQDVLLDQSEAISLWTSLGSFKSSCMEGASPEFTLQILKQLGLDIVKYFASSGNSNPQFTHEKLSKWADCLNANSNDRFSLFIPAIGASINNSLMQSTSGSAYTVTEVLGWGIRNPNGIVYSTALFR